MYTPVSTTTDLRTSGGSISLENLTGNQDAKTSGGRITARQIGGDLEVNTSGGSITIEEIEGYVDAKTSGGRISAANVTGGITARTSGILIWIIFQEMVEAKPQADRLMPKLLSPWITSNYEPPEEVFRSLFQKMQATILIWMETEYVPT